MGVDEKESNEVVSPSHARFAVGFHTVIATAFWPIVGDMYALCHMITGGYPPFELVRVGTSTWIVFGMLPALDLMKVHSRGKFSWRVVGLYVCVMLVLMVPHFVAGAVLDAVRIRDDHGGCLFLTSIGMGAFCGVWSYFCLRHLYNRWCLNPSEVTE